jgi:hypothetical protein
MTFAGVGDPLQHPQVCDFIAMARAVGIRGIHVRTELQCGQDMVDELLASGAHVISVDLNADTRETYRAMMGHDGFERALSNMKRLIAGRRMLAGTSTASFAMPWIVPRIQRRVESIAEIETFYERWQQILGTPVIDPIPPFPGGPRDLGDPLADVSTPPRAMSAELFRRMTILSDGRVPIAELDLDARACVGTIGELPLIELWRKVVSVRRQVLRDSGYGAFELRTFQP